MTRHRRSLTGSSASTSGGFDSAPALTFPAALVHPPRSQVTQYSDLIADKIRQLDYAAQRLGEGFGVSFNSFVLNPAPKPPADNGVAVALVMLAELGRREERISLERRGGQWGLFFTRHAALIGQDKAVETVSIRDAALDVRERFLQRSEEFFREYLTLCEDRLGRMKISAQAGDRTIALLAHLSLE